MMTSLVCKIGTRPLGGKNKFAKHKSKAFTLIELLVVIAIITILAAILFPVFARARENARRAACMSNEQQIGLAVLQYAQDYDGRLPPYWNGRSSNGDFWEALIDPYIKNRQVFYCPSVQTAWYSPSDGPSGYSNTTYGWNYYYLSVTVLPNIYNNHIPGSGGGTCTNGGCGGVMLGSIQSPSETIMLADRFVGSTSTSANFIITWNNNYPITAQHFNGANIAFVDGHVKWMKIPGVATQDATLWDLN